MTGSLRQRGRVSWELRVYVGLDSERGRERWATKTASRTRRSQPKLVDVAARGRLRQEVDDLYRDLLRGGGRGGRPLAPGTVQRVHVVTPAARYQRQAVGRVVLRDRPLRDLIGR